METSNIKVTGENSCRYNSKIIFLTTEHIIMIVFNRSLCSVSVQE